MKTNTQGRRGSMMYERLKAIRMKEYEREVAVTAMVQASLVLDACAWLAQQIGAIGGSVPVGKTASAES